MLKIWLFLCFPFVLLAQMPRIELICESESEKEYLQALFGKKKDSTLSCGLALNLLQREGYWLAECELIDSLLNLKTGGRLELANISVPEESLLARELNNQKLKSLALNESNIEQRLFEILERYNKIGYPFAALELNNYQLSNGKLNAEFNLSLGPRMYLDSLVILGYPKIGKGTIKYELGYEKGIWYSDALLKKLERNTLALPYLNQKRAPAVAFFREGSILYMYLEKANNNQISGIIGLNTNAEGRSTLNGDFRLALQNTFNRGEEINVAWRSPDASVQDFQLEFNYPFVFNSPIGLGSSVSIFRQDSSFVNRNFTAQASYWLAQNSYFLASLAYASSSALGLNTESGFSNLGDFSTRRLRLGIDLNTFNQRLVPSSGYRIVAQAFSAQRLSDDNRINQFGWELGLQYYWSLSPSWVLYNGLKTEALISDNYFENELFRIGGIKTLRGFNELSLFSSAFGILQNELRLMLGKRDYLAVFSDIAYTERPINQGLARNWHWGLGTGLNFQTKGGLFSLFLAVGRTNQDAFDFRSTKVHLSYINVF